MELYAATSEFPPEERFGLQAQVRRAAVSVVTNIAEGCARRSTGEYCRFLEVAFGSAREVEVLLRTARALEILSQSATARLTDQYGAVQGKIANIIKALRQVE